MHNQISVVRPPDTTGHYIGKAIFQEDWWLGTVTSGKWGHVQVESKLGRATFVFGIRQRFGLLSEIYLPPLSPYLGIYLASESELSKTQQYKLLDECVPRILSKLPRYHRLKINLSPEIDWWSPFHWAGFNQHTRYTYMLKNISDQQHIWANFNSNIRRNIKKAEKNIQVTVCDDPEQLYALFEKTMVNQGRKPGYKKSTLVNLYSQIASRNAGCIMLGKDSSGTAHSGLLLVWDDRYSYYLVGGTDPTLRSSGAMPLTMWKAIKKASKYADTFDFEGSMRPGIDRFLRGFGAIAYPYHCLGNGLFSKSIS